MFKLFEEVLVAFSIEAPFALFQKPEEVPWLDSIELAHVPFGLVPKVFDSVDVVLLIGKQLRVVDAMVMKVRHVERVVGPERIGVDDRVGFDLLLDDRQQRLHLGIGHLAVKTLPRLFNRPKTATLPPAPRPRLPLRTPPK